MKMRLVWRCTIVLIQVYAAAICSSNPCKWNFIDILQECSQLKNKLHVWPAGVDENYWNPTCTLSEKTGSDVLVYWKTEPESLCIEVEKLLITHGWNPIRIRYGSYTKEGYKQVLDRCRFAVFISRSESQGIALAECWAMDIPTLVWDPHTVTWLGKVFDPVNAAPYLCSDNGCEWKTIKDLSLYVCQMPALLKTFCPRKWVLCNMTDAVSSTILCTYLGIRW